MIYLNLIVIVLLVLQDIVLWLLQSFNFLDHRQGRSLKEWPRVTVLVPARNEEMLLPSCLQALEKLDYPRECIQFIVGNDQSSDATAHIIGTWVAAHPNRHALDILPLDASRNMNGKARALSQMINIATGDLLLFTDADCQVNPAWVKEMVCAFRASFGVVTGITAVRPKGFFAKMQAIDWWLTQSMIKGTADLAYSVTSMGNNMLISREAYWKVGGFQGLPFSVTEDFALAQAAIEKGYKPVQQVSAGALVMTKSEKNISELLKQRKRWMKGAMALPWYWIVLLALQCGFFPAMLFVVIHHPLWGAGIWIMKMVIQSLLVRSFAGKAGMSISTIHLLLFEFYYLMVSWCTIVYYFWPSSINWKERYYP
ncbi:MAG TPA: glycosyltransferase [Cyclobacteriaceae bacterium]|nr:glycosyltransferase [Cyclobacteriaceae bacterium]